MTDLQQQVFAAIQSGKTDEERTNLSLNAIRMWYLKQGHFHDAYRIEAQTTEELRGTNYGGTELTNFNTMTVDEAITYCYDHKNDYVKDSDDVSEGMEQFECLISCLESGHIKPSELPDYGMEY